MATATLSVPTEVMERTPDRKGVFTRLLEAILEAQMRRAILQLRRYELVPQDDVKAAGYRASLTESARLPFNG